MLILLLSSLSLSLTITLPNYAHMFNINETLRVCNQIMLGKMYATKLTIKHTHNDEDLQ